MVPGGNIRNDVADHVDGKHSIVDAVIPFIYEDDGITRTKACTADVGGFGEGAKAGIPWRRPEAHPGAHGNGSNEREGCGSLLDHDFAGDAAINIFRACVWAEHP